MDKWDRKVLAGFLCGVTLLLAVIFLAIRWM